MNIELTHKELNRAFSFFNKQFFNDSLQTPIIVIQTNGRHKNVLGWCTTNKVWNNNQGSKSFYEITICAEHLNRPIEKLIGTLLHEMVHLSNLQNNIKDVSRGGSYHNKKFKEIAEQHGLIIDFDKRIGWSLTTLKPSVLPLIKKLNLNTDAFEIARREPSIEKDDENEDDETKETKKSSMRKYVCPCCKTIIRATKDVNVVCGICKVDFELEE